MDHGSQSKSPLEAVIFARELHCLNGASTMLNITSQWQDPEFLVFVIRVYCKKIGLMLKPPVPKFRPDLSARLEDITEKHVPAKLKPIEVMERDKPNDNWLGV